MQSCLVAQYVVEYHGSVLISQTLGKASYGAANRIDGVWKTIQAIAACREKRLEHFISSAATNRLVELHVVRRKWPGQQM